MIAWLQGAWAKMATWVAVAAAAIAAVLAAILYGRRKGEQAGLAQAAQEALDEARAQAADVQRTASSRAQTEQDIARLPDAGTQKVADADPATSAGKLRSEGWTRD